MMGSADDSPQKRGEGNVVPSFLFLFLSLSKILWGARTEGGGGRGEGGITVRGSTTSPKTRIDLSSFLKGPAGVGVDEGEAKGGEKGGEIGILIFFFPKKEQFCCF